MPNKTFGSTSESARVPECSSKSDRIRRSKDGSLNICKTANSVAGLTLEISLRLVNFIVHRLISKNVV